jgi:prolyl-tRNA editing enzyme YbaK/EbsC (Cys-tRNA(Pro) deacylase)/ubiquinone/menaquinone biosynthesis C-methylase UbiE
MPVKTLNAKAIDLGAISPAQIYDNVTKRLDLEQISHFFTKAPTQFRGVRISYNFGEGVIIAFKTLKHKYDADYDRHLYRILIIFKIYPEELFDDKNFRSLINDFDRLRGQENIKQFVIFSQHSHGVPAQTITALKGHHVHVVFLDGWALAQNHVLSSFIFDNRLNPTQTLETNLVCDEIVKRLKKFFHTVLSDIAAPVYDKLYGTTKFATALVMQKEEQVVDDILASLNLEQRKSSEELIAVDAGTGTGRHAFRFANRFSRVHAFDVSTDMIEMALQKKVASDDMIISFSVADLEYEEIDREQEFTGKVDFICASFGMGSFIEDTSQMLRRFHEWLKPGGAALISFYNANTIVDCMKPNWRDTSLAAHIDADKLTAQVTLEDQTFYIFCKPYKRQLEDELKQLFDVKMIFSYPCITAILPNSMFDQEEAKTYFSHVDNLLLPDEGFFYGHYVFVHVVKRPNASPFERVRSFLESRNISHQIIEHSAVHTIDDVRSKLGLKYTQMAKTMVFALDRKRRDRKGRIAVVVMRGDNDVIKREIANELGVSRDSIELASREQIAAMGLVLGGISPLGFEQRNVTFFIDRSFDRSNEEHIFMGSGDNSRTVKLQLKDFREITRLYRRIDGKKSTL